MELKSDATKSDPCPAIVERVIAVVPCLNEAPHLESVVCGLLREGDWADIRVVIADGGSTDGSVEIAKRLAALYPAVVYFHNEKKIQSAALNRAVAQFGVDRDYLIRVDAHCRYPADYCRSLLDEQKRTGADSVVVSMVAEGSTCFQRAGAMAQNSKLGNGGSAHRMGGQGRFVDHGHHALISIPAFLAAGGYDERFTHNEDAELDVRLKQAGYTIWLMANRPIVYFPRKAPSGLLRQYLNYGRGRAKTVFKHRQRPKLRQSLPLAVGPAVMMLPLGLAHPIFAVPGAVWAALCLSYGAMLGLRSRSACAAGSGFAAMTMHLGWSLGFLGEVLRQVRGRDVQRALSPSDMGEARINQ